MNIWRYSCNLTKQCRILIIFLLFHSIAYSQDSISVLGECSQAELAVNVEYLFELISSEEGAETASWSIQKDGIDYSKFFVISGVGKSVSIKGSSSVLSLVADDTFEVHAVYGKKVNFSFLNVHFNNLIPNEPFYITSNHGSPHLHTSSSVAIELMPGEVVTFKAHLSADSISDIPIWSVGTPCTFIGTGIITKENELIYYAISQKDPSLTSGIDTIEVSDGKSTIVITIIISSFIGESACDITKELSIMPNNDKKIVVAPTDSISFSAYGGTCSYTWSLVEDNSGAMLGRINNLKAVYVAGNINNSVDVIEVSDGISTKRVEIIVASNRLSGSGGNGCFIRNKNSQRD